MSLDFVPEITASMGVKDLDSAIQWYGKILGFQPLYKVDEIGWAELTTHMPGVNVGLSQNEVVTLGGGATNVWSVADIEEAKAHLDAHNVKQDGDIQTIPDMVKLLTFYDPDGNAMMFAQTINSA